MMWSTFRLTSLGLSRRSRSLDEISRQELKKEEKSLQSAVYGICHGANFVLGYELVRDAEGWRNSSAVPLPRCVGARVRFRSAHFGMAQALCPTSCKLYATAAELSHMQEVEQ